MKNNYIKSFRVEGLFGTNDINIIFDENKKILIGENGLGKTQILNLLYYTLTRNFLRLNDFNFEKLVIVFENDEIEIKKDEVKKSIEGLYKEPEIREFIKEFGYAQFESFNKKFSQNKRKSYELERILEANPKFRKYPIHRLFRYFEEFDKQFRSNSNFKESDSKIKKVLEKSEILYFPTYRRVEEDLHNLGYNDDEFLEEETTLIQFGMEDVDKEFKKLESKIDRLLKEGLTQFTKDVLNIVIDDNVLEKNFLEKTSEEDINLILSRVGPLLSDVQKTSIKTIVIEKKVNNQLSVHLLNKLVESYEKQKPLDKLIKIFRDVCNKYLVNKEIFYDESNIKIFIKSKITNEKIELKNLSSGEKQIISIFSKIYLSPEENRFIILFDEPELSLSMLWQKELLPDIVNSLKCNFLLAVTHSPFIFDNELNKYAVGLNEYFSLSKNISK
ncbi:AAA family ATPase [Flavobacterium sp.]|uniref:AAA family ATPase n=1 Tax=Flavobacterium sp. TaxID=239 RepID=UPI0037526980